MRWLVRRFVVVLLHLLGRLFTVEIVQGRPGSPTWRVPLRLPPIVVPQLLNCDLPVGVVYVLFMLLRCWLLRLLLLVRLLMYIVGPLVGVTCPVERHVPCPVPCIGCPSPVGTCTVVVAKGPLLLGTLRLYLTANTCNVRSLTCFSILNGRPCGPNASPRYWRPQRLIWVNFRVEERGELKAWYKPHCFSLLPAT